MERSSIDTTKYGETRPNPTSKERTPLEPVAKGKIRERKGGDGIIQKDMQSIGSYILQDVLIPTGKKLVAEIINNSINMLFYGDTRGPAGSGYNNNRFGDRSSIGYGGYYCSNVNYGNNQQSSYGRFSNKYTFEMATREDAMNLLDRVYEILELPDGVLSVADIKDLLGMPITYTDNKYGWTRLPMIEPHRGINCWTIDFPNPNPIN